MAPSAANHICRFSTIPTPGMFTSSAALAGAGAARRVEDCEARTALTEPGTAYAAAIGYDNAKEVAVTGC